MNHLFNADNPVWKFIGRLADFFLLTLLWLLCSLPIVTIGASTSALYYITLKMAADQEGELIKPFFTAFKRDFKQATGVWLVYLALGALLALDLMLCLQSTGTMGWAMLLTFAVLAFLWGLFVSFSFAVVARCDNTVYALLKMGIAMSLQNFLPVLSALVVNVALIGVGIFVFWPVLLVAPALAAYLNSFLFNRILEKYHLNIPA